MIFLKRNNTGRSKLRRFAIAFGVGFGLYLLTALLGASLILKESIPESQAQIVLCVAAAIGGLASGMISGGGEGNRLFLGALAGAMVAFGVLIAKGVANQETHWTIYTTIAVASCVVFGGAGSCILHKRNKKSTKVKKQKRRKNYA